MRLWIVVVCVVGVVAMVGGEQRKFSSRYSQRVQEIPTKPPEDADKPEDSETPENGEKPEDSETPEESSDTPTPYPPAGYRPSRKFVLPTEDKRNLLEPPAQEDSSSEDASGKEEPESSQLNEAKVNLNPEDVEEVDNTVVHKPREQPESETQQGVYYVILPSGQLQRRQYLAKVIDLRRMDYQYAQYANSEPLSGPIYAVNPNSQFLQIVA